MFEAWPNCPTTSGPCFWRGCVALSQDHTYLHMYKSVTFTFSTFKHETLAFWLLSLLVDIWFCFVTVVNGSSHSDGLLDPLPVALLVIVPLAAVTFLVTLFVVLHRRQQMSLSTLSGGAFLMEQKLLPLEMGLSGISSLQDVLDCSSGSGPGTCSSSVLADAKKFISMYFVYVTGAYATPVGVS